ncbi:MAG TPA: hypothetical protein PKA55_21165 [Rhodoblastus sp.]|nr:hypothetical protein [Rhodoblastus sp.]
MTFSRSLVLFALALSVAGGAAQAQEKKKPSCQSIFNICMKRAGSGHAAICQDMFASAKANGEWQATVDEQGVHRPPVPCTP